MVKTPALQTSFSSSSFSSRRGGIGALGLRPPLSPAATASVQVVVRVRPLNEREKKYGTLPVISASTSDRTVTVIKGSGSRQVKSSYKFDNVFTSFSTQEDVFEATLQPIIRDVLNGFESTVFAYGQTGTGKTHTMEGDLSNVQEHGVIPRSAAAIFDALEKDPDYVSSTVYCSLLEIYNEELSDLLVDRGSSKRGKSSSKAMNAAKLTIMEGENGPFCRGLSELEVASAEELLGLMQKAHQQRHTGETEMNKESSRSHCIFTLRVKAKRKLIDGSALEVGGKLHCVDLAGSECAKACGNAGKEQAARERERMNINRSLLTLGRVVKLLKEKSEKPSSNNSVRIPYRDSKLTRILQESLGGRCKTCLIATISPSVTAIEESMSTLNYAQAANGIINKPKTTSLMSVGGFDNKSPRNADGAGGSVEHWHEMECRLEYMQSQVDEAQQALARKHIQHQEFMERAEKAELAQELAERKFEKATHDIAVLEEKVEDVKQQLEASEKSLREIKVVLGATQRTEICLTEEATALIEVLQTTITDGDRMHETLLEKRKEDVDRKTATREYQTMQTKLLNDLLKNLQYIDQVQKVHRSELETANGDHKAGHLQLLNQHSVVVDEMKRDCVSDIESLKTSIRDGVLPVFRTLTSSSKEKLNALSTKLVNGEESLRSQCQSVLEQLTDNSNRIAEIEQSYVESSRIVVDTLTTHLEAAKENLDGTVERITVALQKANADRDLQRETLKMSIDGFRDRCNSSIDHTELLAKSHTNRLQQSIQTMKDGRGNQSSILKSLSDLDGFLGKKKDEHVQKLERQLAILTKQHDVLISVNQTQQEMNKAMVSSVMSGVHSLIEKEMKSMDDFQSKYFRSLITANEESKIGNQNVNAYTSDTFGHIGSVNKSLDTNIRHVFNEQAELCTSLENETSEFDANIKSYTEALRKPVENLSHETTEALQKWDAEDRDCSESIIGKTRKHIQTTTNELENNIQQGVEKGISELQVSTTEGFKYVREQVIDPVHTEVVDNIQAKQNQINALARGDLALFELELDESGNAVVEQSNKGLEIASAVEQRLEVGVSEMFAATIHEHRDLIQGSKWLENAVKAQEETMSKQVSKSSALVSSSTDRLGDFGRFIILVEDATPEVQERSVPEYSDRLTSTNEPEVLLREAGLVVDNHDSSSSENVKEMHDSSMNENNENRTEKKVRRRESSIPPSKTRALRDRSSSVNSVKEIDVSPPLKRSAERTTRSSLPNASRRSRKRVKTVQR